MGDNSKWILESKTFLVNLLGFVLVLLPPTQEYFKENPQVVSYVIAAGTVINIVLRFMTKKEVVIYRSKKPPRL